MLYAFQPLLCLKLCWHNRLKPKPEPNMLKILPIIPSNTSQDVFLLFLFYSHIITYYSHVILYGLFFRYSHPEKHGIDI